MLKVLGIRAVCFRGGIIGTRKRTDDIFMGFK